MLTINELSEIDVCFDFTSDSVGYWNDFWDNNDGLGAGSCDPDAASKTLQQYHRLLWSKELPCEEKMELSMGTGSSYLSYKNFRFGSDSIIASFRYKKYKYMIDEVAAFLPNQHHPSNGWFARPYKGAVTGQRLKTLAFTLFKPYCL